MTCGLSASIGRSGDGGVWQGANRDIDISGGTTAIGICYGYADSGCARVKRSPCYGPGVVTSGEYALPRNYPIVGSACARIGN